MIMEKKRMDCPSLPPGWKKEEVIRKSGLSAGKCDVYYYSPKGKKFRSKPQLSRYLGNTVDLGCFDFRTGKMMMPSKLQKNKQRLRNENLTINKSVCGGWGVLPIVLFVTVFLRSCCPVSGVGPDTSDETLLTAIASALHMSSSPITGQTTSAAEKNPAIWLNTSQPLCKAFIVTDQDIREQELKVIQARRTLEDALMADGLARAVESSRDSEDKAA
ncbi:methyl-CpG-binding domain protein 2-like [Salvelinus namaycush]|uniref:Methyl-CpG-binding domain protein 2-like n=1 Tax=Salvelinus namaycush TaxID=8040 RepID=A0A8U0QJ64_SALNM|nr:methyl-CpG-binding domain protein 2-like [Salvelinus namaycush]